MGQDQILIHSGKHKRPKDVHKNATPSDVASWQQAIGTSNNFVNDAPREVRHHNAADLPRELYRRWILYATATFLAQYAFDAQAEMNLRTGLYSHKDSPIFSEPTSNNGADTTVATSRTSTRPSANATRVQGYGNIAGRNMTFAPPLGPAQSELGQPASWYEQAANALSWLNPFAFDDSPDSDYRPSAWPFQDGDAAHVGRRQKVTRRPENHHGGHQQQQHHHHGNGTAAAHEPLLVRILRSIVSRRELGEVLMLAKGVDPHALYKHRVSPPFSASTEEMKAGIDLYIESQKTDLFTRNTYAPAIEALPKLDDIFWNYFDSIQAQAKHNITHELTETAHHRYNFPKSGGGGTYTLKAVTLAQLLSENIESDTSSIGYIVDVEDYVWDRTESYVIAPAHYPALIKISTDENEQIEWVKRNQKLFFNAKLKAPKSRREITMQEVKRFSNLTAVFDAAAGYLSQNILNAFKDDAFGETRREKMINKLQWHIPFYAAWVNYKRHEYTEAAVRGILDVVSLAGGPFSKALKAAGIATESGRIINIAKQLRTGAKVAKVGKKAKKINAAIDSALEDQNSENHRIAPAGTRIGGSPGRAFAEYLADEVNQTQERTG
jgi:hypothetical protein